MGAISYFSPDQNGKLQGSSFAEPDGTEHEVELLEGNGRMILRVRLADSDKSVDLVFTDEQAIDFTGSAEAILRRIGLDKR